MNKIYRLVFNHELGVMQVASERVCPHAAGASKARTTPRRPGLARTLMACCLSFGLASSAWAVNNPASATILDGSNVMDPASLPLYDLPNIALSGMIIGYENDGFLTIRDGVSLDANGVTLGYQPGVAGRLDLIGPGTTLSAGGFFFSPGIEVGYAGSGTFNILGGAVATDISRVRIGHEQGSDGTVNIDGDGSELRAQGATVGRAGTGTLNLTDGGHAVIGNVDSGGTSIYVGELEGSIGAVVVDGAGSHLEATGNRFSIGHGGSGSLTISNGGLVSHEGNGLRVGTLGTGAGNVRVTGAGSLLSTSSLLAGVDGDGEIIVDNGARIESYWDTPGNWLYLGQNATGIGNALIEGAGTTLDAKGRASYIGYDGEGTLTVQGGAQATFGNLSLGVEEDASGTVLVRGVGTVLSTGADNTVYVGNAGVGDLQVLEGAELSVGSMEIGTLADADTDLTSHVLVSGAGSTLKASGNVFISPDKSSGSSNYPSHGSLVVEEGASVEVGSLYLERDDEDSSQEGTGELRISGAGTTFSASGEFIVSAHFSLTDGAQLDTVEAGIRRNFVTLPGERAVVAGADTVWTNTGNLTVNIATDITDGAQVTTGTLLMGPSGWANSGTPPTLISELRVLGEGSLLTTTGDLTLGAGSFFTEAPGYLVLAEGGSLQAGGDIHLAQYGGLVFGAGMELDANNLPVFGDAVAAGSVNEDARFVFDAAAGDDKLVFNHTGEDLVLGNTMLSEGYTTGARSWGGISTLAGTTRLAGDMSQFASKIDVSGGKLVLESDINVKPADHDPDSELAYSQDIAVTGGSLIVNGNLGFDFTSGASTYGTSYVDVNDAGTLGGNGNIVGVVNVFDGGRIAPGDASAATLSVQGDLIFGKVGHYDGTAFYDVDVLGNGTSDLLDVSGLANLDEQAVATTVSVNALDPGTSYQTGQQYTILTASGGVAGTFDQVLSNSAFLTPTLSYDANNVFLTVALDTSAVGVVVADGEVLTGTGTWASIDVLSGGTVSPGTSSVRLGTISATGPINFAAGSFYDVDIRGNGSSDLLTTSGTATLEGGTVRVTALDPETSYQDGQAYTILTAQGGLTGTFANAFSNSAFITPSLSYTGTDTILTIALATQSDDGIVEDGEILTGTGTYDDIEVRSGGTLSPGDGSAPIGTIRANDTVVFRAGSFYDVDIRGDGSSDLVDSAGNATLEGGTVRVTALDPETSYQDGQQYTILSADGGISGTFAGAVSRSAFIAPSLSYTQNDALLTIALTDVPGPGPGGPAIFQTVAETRNQYNVAMALNTLPQTGDALALYNRLLMLSADEARNAFGHLSGEVHASTRTALFDDRLVRDAVSRRMVGNVHGESAGGVTAWIDGSSVNSGIDSDGNGARSSGQRTGVVAGVDWVLGDALTLGVTAGVEDIDHGLRAWHSMANVDARHFGIYASTGWGGFSLQGGASHAWFDVDTVRHVAIDARAPDRVTSGYDATATTFFAEGGWTFDLGHTRLTPYLGVAHTRLRTDGVTEQGASTALDVAESKDELLTATAGVRASWDVSGPLAEGTRLTAGLGWQNANGELKQEHRANLVAGGDGFTVYGAPLGRNTGIAELGMSLPLSESSTVQLGMQGRFGDGHSDAGGHVNWTWNF